MKRREFLKRTAAGSVGIVFYSNKLLAESYAAGLPRTGHEGLGDDSRLHEEAFVSPPKMAKPHTWWHWMNGHVSKEGITLDLEAMKRVGLGGFHIFQVGEDYYDAGPACYGSPENLEMLRHAAKEAERLGLCFGVHNSPGWSSSGGPWIPVELSMQVVTWSEVTVAGGGQISVQLPRPSAQLDYYRDAFILAFPAQAGGIKQIPDWKKKANYPSSLKGESTYDSPPLWTNGNSPQQPEPFSVGEGIIDPNTVHDLTERIKEDGMLLWDAPKGQWTILRIGHTTTRAHDNPAPTGGFGLECDKFSRKGIEFHFQSFYNKDMLALMRPFIDKGIAGATIDSYEVGMQNWTADFPEEFRRRTGYDLRSYLPCMTGRVVGSFDISERFLWDLRSTQAQLMSENYYGRFVELCHEHGITGYIEPYDAGPFDEASIGARPDVPMAEFWVGESLNTSDTSVPSYGHLNGRGVIAAESFTGLAQFTESPATLKTTGDLMYTLGINKFILHCFAMQPNPYAVPGMTMAKWGSSFNRNNTWYEQGHAWVDYLARCQYLLQRGVYVADVLYFIGEDSPMHVDASRFNPHLPFAYGHDLIDAESILNRIEVYEGRIVLRNGASYRLLFMPPMEAITLPLAQKLHQLVEQGMCLVVSGPPPKRTPSLTLYPDSDAKLQEFTKLWGETSGRHSFGRGKVFRDTSIQDALDQSGVPPDFEFTSASGTTLINFIHRRANDVDIYFVANRSHTAEEIVCSLRAEAGEPELWDPVRGITVPAKVYDRSYGRLVLPLQFGPGGSIFVIVRPASARAHLKYIASAGGTMTGTAGYTVPQQKLDAVFMREPDTTMTLAAPPIVDVFGHARNLLVYRDGVYELTDHAGKIQWKAITGIPRPLPLEGIWELHFQADRGAPVSCTLARLIPLSEHPEEGIRYFSGTCTYTTMLNVAPEYLEQGRVVQLDLGRVEVIVDVVVNGKNLGTLWCVPYSIDVTDALRAGDNKLELLVTNTWHNRLIGDEHLPAENGYGHKRGSGSIDALPEWYDKGRPKPGQRITFVTWKYWNADSPLQPSGLIGPVVLRFAACLSVEGFDEHS